MTTDDAVRSLSVTLRYWRKDDLCVVKCDELGVSTFDPVPLAGAILHYLAALAGQPIPRKPCASTVRTSRNSPSL